LSAGGRIAVAFSAAESNRGRGCSGSTECDRFSRPSALLDNQTGECSIGGRLRQGVATAEVAPILFQPVFQDIHAFYISAINSQILIAFVDF
jgi:hypothetical protein